MKSRIALAMMLAVVLTPSLSSANPVDAVVARAVAEARLHELDAADRRLAWQEEIVADKHLIAYMCGFEPAGFVVVAADSDLPPVVAYSLESSCPREDFLDSPLRRLVAADLASRLAARALVEPSVMAPAHARWLELTGNRAPVGERRFEQWPPAGTTPTGGWLASTWTQSAPYNSLCPLDVAHAGARSQAGCPSVAMAMILNFHRTILGTRLDETDRYWHGYAGNYYWVPDAAAQYGFPDFGVLKGYLETLTLHWDAGAALTNTDKAALVFACGVAARQVYSAAGSGTFGVDQAYDAYVRFGFGSGCELLTDADSNLYAVLADNMRQARPAHLAVVDPGWTMGHNLVVDGYNTDDYFHLNFGWGGSYNGWYLLPQGMPYGLTVVEGVIVNLSPWVSAVDGEAPPVVSSLGLGAAPNPFNPLTTIRFELPRSGPVKLAVFDPAGRLVRILVDGDLPAGSREAVWDGRDASGRGLPSGSYLARLDAGGQVGCVRLTLVQ